MTANLIDGKNIAATVRAEVQARVRQRVARGTRAPGLAVVLVGRDPASEIYVRTKRKACADVKASTAIGSSRDSHFFHVLREAGGCMQNSMESSILR